MQNNAKIAILLATYNAGKYLAEQIDSILTQSYEDWTLYIQDDGSKDNTRTIIDDYVRRHPEKIIHVDLGLTHQGCCGNFMSLLNVVDSTYYMFCDQDDVWLPEKVAVSLAKMKEMETQYGKDCPLLLHTDRTFVREDLTVFQKSEWNPRGLPMERIQKKIKKLENPGILGIYNICAGNTMCFNYAVKGECFPYLNIRVHDSNVAMAVANRGGVIEPLMQSTVLYRIHSGQTCGVKQEPIFRKLLRFPKVLDNNLLGYHIWKLYGYGSFLRYLYYRVRYFLILRLN